MEPLSRVEGPAATLPDNDIDTDVIYPARFLLLMNKTGLGRYAFHDRRFDLEGVEVEDFVLNRPPWREARILVVGRNFGCGSSREQAVWTLRDFGIRCVIAGSFGEIFFSNCQQNGVLAITLAAPQLAQVSRAASAGTQVQVDLETQLIRMGGTNALGFDIEPARRDALLNGWDATELILKRDGEAIAAFEARHHRSCPWLFR